MTDDELRDMAQKEWMSHRLVEGLNTQMQRERAATQMTLGQLITALEHCEAETISIGNPHSYRGYYCDLSLEPLDEPIPVSDLIGQCYAAMGKVFEGYKGGDFLMGESTPIWVANYACCGERLMALHTDGTLELAEEKD